MIPPTNNPDISVAAEWAGELDAWAEAHGLCGYDPFDVKQHPWIRAAQPWAPTRKVTTALCDLFPNTIRRVLRVAPTENPKAHALVALGALRLHQVSGDEAFLDRALGHLGWLRTNALNGHAGLCWGYPFDVFGKGVDTPRGTPIGVVSAIAGEAFLAAHALCGEDALLEAARSIAEFLLRGLPRLEADDGTYCFAYTPVDRRRVHNANLLAAALLFRVAAATGEDALREAAEPALRFTLARQREDGAWPYGVAVPDEAHDAGLLALVDHHHTGFVLRALHDIDTVRPDEALQDALGKGYHFYRRTLFRPNGMPVNEYGAYPVDIHACAEAVLCFAALSDRIPGALRHATAAMRWTYWWLRVPESGAVWQRKYPLHTARLVCPRWGVAWMHRALAEYLYRSLER